MSSPYVGEIRLFAGNFAPSGWAFCDGTLQAIAQNTTLFNLIGTTYGGDGQTTFALPDLRGRVPVHMGNPFVIGQSGGVETVTLTLNQIPVHSHPLQCSALPASSADPTAGYPAASAALTQFSDQVPNATLNPAGVGPVGGSQPHDNMHPFVGINFIISFFGIFPSPT